MKRTLALVSLAVALGVPAVANAQTAEKPWLIRVRALTLNPANKSDAFSALGVNFGSDAVHVSNKTFPEVDFSYFFNEKFALELVLTYPQKHDVVLSGVGKIGSVTHLPPCLVAQYHYAIPNSNFKPYVGLGLNYTRITNSSLAVGTTPLGIERDSFGFVFQLGTDVKIGDNLYLNFDYKRAQIGFDVRAGGAKLTTAELNPNLFSIGIGKRF